jgi:outer membrane lipoprotein SlyB
MTATTASAPAATGSKRTAAIVGGAALLVSLGAGAGWLMRGPAEPAATPPAQQVALAPAATPTSSTPQLAADDEVEAPAKAAPKPEAERAPARKPTPKPAPAKHAQPAPHGNGAAPAEQRAAAPAVCHTCGVVEGVTEVQQKGEANGVGAVGGAVVGGLIGNQMGGGNGKKALTVLGAVGGGLAGHEVEKRVRGETLYQVRVRMDDGSVRTVTTKSAWTNGSRVVVEGSGLRAG